MHTYRTKALTILLFLLVAFFLIGLYAYIQLQREVAILHIGLSYYEENLIILVFSILSMIKVIYDIYQVEHPKQFEKRVKRKLLAD